jgi:hypothetical protein
MPPKVQSSNAAHYRAQSTITEVVEYGNEPHLLPAAPVWEEIADEVLAWAVRHATTPPAVVPGPGRARGAHDRLSRHGARRLLPEETPSPDEMTIEERPFRPSGAAHPHERARSLPLLLDPVRRASRSTRSDHAAAPAHYRSSSIRLLPRVLGLT